MRDTASFPHEIMNASCIQYGSPTPLQFYNLYIKYETAAMKEFQQTNLTKSFQFVTKHIPILDRCKTHISAYLVAIHFDKITSEFLGKKASYIWDQNVQTTKVDKFIFPTTQHGVNGAHCKFFPSTSPRPSSFYHIHTAFISLNWTNGSIINAVNTICNNIKCINSIR